MGEKNNMATKIYRIPEEKLHKKRYGKYTMTDIIVKGRYSHISHSGIFYHYTSPDGLKGILKNRYLFFTDCQFLNDHNERLQINCELDIFWRNNKKYYDKSFVTLLKDIRVSNYEDGEYSYMESDLPYGMKSQLNRYFVFSTSSNEDSLSLWKYYAKDNKYNGYCIGLLTDALSDEWIDRDTGVAIEAGSVIYTSKEKQYVIWKTVEELYDSWCKYKISDKFNQKIARDFQSWVSITALFFKDECFKDEEEYRFVAIAPSNNLKSLSFDYNGYVEKMYDFRVVDGVLIPYLKMPFNFWNTDECWPIFSIGISPSLNYEQKKLGLEHYIKSLDYELPNFHIYTSKIPLRY